MTRTLLALLLAAIPILSVGQSDARIVKPEIRVGHSWTYRSTNVLGPGVQDHETRVSFADDKVILVVSTRKSDGKEFDSSWTSDWNAVTSHSGRMYRPHSGFYQFPLRVGDKYSIKFEFLRPRGNNVIEISTGTATVVGWETVEVPAGKFRAMKVEMKGTFQPFDGSRDYPVHSAQWYVPDVRRWVKSQVVSPNFTISEELLAYKLNED